jgi:microcystin-dependent protein
MEYWGGTAPPKWLFAFGQAISRVTYSQLFTLFGTAYGAGDGSTTFNIPDVRGRVVAAADNMGGTAAGRLLAWTLGVAGGAQGHNLTEAELAPHAHGVTVTLSGNTGGRSAAHSHTVPGNVPSGTGAVNSPGYNTAGSGPLANSEQTLGETQDHYHYFSGTGTFATDYRGSGAGHNNVQPTIAANYIIYAGV